MLGKELSLKTLSYLLTKHQFSPTCRTFCGAIKKKQKKIPTLSDDKLTEWSPLCEKCFQTVMQCAETQHITHLKKALSSI